MEKKKNKKKKKNVFEHNFFSNELKRFTRKWKHNFNGLNRDIKRLHLRKERLTGEGKKLKSIWYGSFMIVKQIGDNVFQLDLPSNMHMYSIINVENLKLFEPSLFDDEPDVDVCLPSVDDLKKEREDPLKDDCILEQKVCDTRCGKYEYFCTDKKDQLPSKSKWYMWAKVITKFPHLKITWSRAQGS